MAVRSPLWPKTRSRALVGFEWASFGAVRDEGKENGCDASVHMVVGISITQSDAMNLSER